MQTTTTINGSQAVLALGGASTSPPTGISAAPANLVDNPAVRDIVIDFTQVDYMDSSALGMLLLLRQGLKIPARPSPCARVPERSKGSGNRQLRQALRLCLNASRAGKSSRFSRRLPVNMRAPFASSTRVADPLGSRQVGQGTGF